MPAYLSPIGNEQQGDASGNPLSGGFIFTYLAGTSTLASTFTDAAATIPQANPIELNASGLPASPIYINGGVSMKFIIQNAASVPQRTIDDIEGVNDPLFTGAVTEWVNFSGAPTFVNATGFGLAGDQTLIFQVNRRIKTINSGGTIYSTITASVFSGVTSITVVNDAGVLDSGLSSVQYGLLEATNPSIPETSFGRSIRTAANAPTAFATTRIDVASATTVNLTTSAPNTQNINITGTTTITGVTVAIGQMYYVRFAGILTLTNNAAIITQTGANITTAAGDTCIFRATAANIVEVLAYSPAGLVPSSATPLANGVAAAGTAFPYARQDHVHPRPTSMIRLHTSNGYGSTNTCILRMTTSVVSTGSDITYADSATLGGTFTINTLGTYAICASYHNAASGGFIGLSLNSSQLTTAIGSITAADRLNSNQTSASGGVINTSWTGSLAASDVIRLHADTGGSSFPALGSFTIMRVA